MKGQSLAIEPITKLDLESIAESFLYSIFQYDILCKDLEKEFQQTNGWLKMTKLNECTGKTAREKLTNEFENKKNVAKAK